MNELRTLRKKYLKKEDEKELDDFLKVKNDKWYIEAVFEKNKLFKYLLFLRKKGADLNNFFDTF